MIKWKLIGKNKRGQVLCAWEVSAFSLHMIHITFNVKLMRSIVANLLAKRMHIRTFASARAVRSTFNAQMCQKVYITKSYASNGLDYNGQYFSVWMRIHWLGEAFESQNLASDIRLFSLLFFLRQSDFMWSFISGQLTQLNRQQITCFFCLIYCIERRNTLQR